MTTLHINPEPQPRTHVTLHGLSPSQIPPPTAPASDLVPFLTTILSEAIPLISSLPSTATTTTTPVLPSTAPPPTTYTWKPITQKHYPASSAPVDLFSLATTSASTSLVTSSSAGSTLTKETWIARRSVHADAAAAGSASWREFVACLKDRHVETEAACTRSVVGVWRGAGWQQVEGIDVNLDDGKPSYTNFSMSALAVRHRIGRPVLRDRVFPLVQITCSSSSSSAAVPRLEDTEAAEFLVISLCVPELLASSSDLLSFSSAEASTPLLGSDGRDITRTKEEISRGALTASYVSVERVRKVSLGGSAEDGHGHGIEWTMATASDAKGVLPMFVQTQAVPGQIAVDVPYFLGWVNGEREKRSIE